LKTLYDIKPAFVRLLEPLVGVFARRGVTPNQLTAAAWILSAAGGAALWLFPGNRVVWVAVALVLLVRMALNAADGALARRTGRSSRAGELFNEVSDVLADACLYIPLVAVAESAGAVVALFVLVAGWTELCGVAAKAAGGTRRYDGPLGKSDRALAVGAYLVARAAGIPGGRWQLVFFGILVLLSAWTCVNRVRRAFA
jgi:CDP-diacylglycerol--glycerol-3-phosphate 3-phosphatidyltransferase